MCRYSSLFKQLGYGVDLVMPFLRRVIGIRDELSQLHFIKPTVTVPVATDEVVDGKVKVDSDGMIQGVEKLSCNFPEEVNIVLSYWMAHVCQSDVGRANCIQVYDSWYQLYYGS